MPPQPRAALDAPAGNSGRDVTTAQSPPAARDVKRLVGMQLAGSTTGPTAWLADRRNAINHRLQENAVVDVGRAQQHGERNALAIHNEMTLRTRLAPVRRVRANLLAASLRGQAGRIEGAPAPVNQPGAAQQIEQLVVKGLPKARLLPVPQPPPAGHAGAAAHLLWKHLPRDAGLQDEEDAGECGAIIERRTAAFRTRWSWREQRSKEGPQTIRNQTSCHPPRDGNLTPPRPIPFC